MPIDQRLAKSGTAPLRASAAPEPDSRPRNGSAQSIQRSLITGASLGTFGVLYQQFISLLSGLIVARLLGAADYGVFNLTRNLAISVGTFTKMGFDIGVLRRIGERAGEESDQDVGSFTLAATLLLMAAGLIPFFICLSGAGTFLETHFYPYRDFAFLLALMMLANPCASLVQVIGGIFRSRDRIWPAVFSEYLLQPSLRLILSVVLVVYGYGLFGVVLANVLAPFCSFLYSLLRAAFRFKIFDRGLTLEIWRDTFSVGQYSMALGISVTLLTVTRSFDVFVLGKYASAEEIGRYVIIQMVVSTIMMIGSAFGQPMGPLIAGLWRQRRYTEIESMCQQNARWICVATAPLFVLICWQGADLIQIFGPSYQVEAGLVSLLALGQFVIALLANSGWVLSMTGRQMQESRLLFYSLGVAVIANLVLVPHYQAYGAALASLAAGLIANGTRLLFISRELRLNTVSSEIVAPVALALSLAAGLHWAVNAAPAAAFLEEFRGAWEANLAPGPGALVSRWIAAHDQAASNFGSSPVDLLNGAQTWLSKSWTPIFALFVSALYGLIYLIAAFFLLFDAGERNTLRNALRYKILRIGMARQV